MSIPDTMAVTRILVEARAPAHSAVSYMTSGRFSSGMCSRAPSTTVQPLAS